MKKSEVKTAGNCELISALCYAHVGGTVSKKDRDTVRFILAEFARRGIIYEDDAEEMIEHFNETGYC